MEAWHYLILFIIIGFIVGKFFKDDETSLKVILGVSIAWGIKNFSQEVWLITLSQLFIGFAIYYAIKKISLANKEEKEKLEALLEKIDNVAEDENSTEEIIITKQTNSKWKILLYGIGLMLFAVGLNLLQMIIEGKPINW